MNVIKQFCGNCGGTGKAVWWEIVDYNDADGIAQRKENICEACNGKGYTEHAVFTIEEAKTILKHCGLSTEN